MTKLELLHTSALDAPTLVKAQRLMAEVFDGDLSDTDWDHALGGMHALLWSDDDLVGHASVVQRRLLNGGRALRAGYVEVVGVHPDHRRSGHAAAMMTTLESVIRGAYDLGALCAADGAAAFYTARGWLPWKGGLYVLTPTGRVRTPEEEGAVLVFPATAALDLNTDLTCDFRDGDAW